MRRNDRVYISMENSSEFKMYEAELYKNISTPKMAATTSFAI